MALEFRCLTVGPLETNCYIIWDDRTRSAAIIDPGGEPERIIDSSRTHELNVEWVLLTHGHADHCFYAADVAEQFGARIGIHPADVELIQQSLGIIEQFYDLREYRQTDPSDLLTEGDIIRLGDLDVKVLHTPGHSAGSVSYVTEIGVFCGDTVFAGSIGRTDFPGGSHVQLVDSIKSKLLILPDSTVLYPGHGPATTVAREKRTNPYLR